METTGSARRSAQPLTAVAPTPARAPRARRVASTVLLCVIAASSATGIVLFAMSRGQLWLDEAQSVAIAREPLGSLFDALREDGSPPLYYVALHGWMRLFGDGVFAVRALSGVFAALSVPAIWLLGRRAGGRTTAWTASVLLCTSPFLIRYSTETRMYSLVVLLVILGAWCIARAFERASIGRLALVSVCAGALVLTHYWSLYLLGAVLVALVIERWHGQRVAVRVAVAIVVGMTALVPWLPSFVFQMRRTGAPWAGRPSLGIMLDSLRDYAATSGLDSAGWILWLSLVGLVALGVFARRRRSGILELRWPGRGLRGSLALVTTLTLTAAVLVGMVTSAPVAGRYTAVVFPIVVMIVALGASVLRDEARLVIVAIAAVTGVMGGLDSATLERTQVPQVAAAIENGASAADLVVYCPDQLGPSTTRLLDDDIRQVTFPSFEVPARVRWVDYLDRARSTDVEQFARQADAMASTGDVWLVTAPNYLTMSSTCSRLHDALTALRPSTREVVSANGDYFEQAELIRLSASIG